MAAGKGSVIATGASCIKIPIDAVAIDAGAVFTCRRTVDTDAVCPRGEPPHAPALCAGGSEKSAVVGYISGIYSLAVNALAGGAGGREISTVVGCISGIRSLAVNTPAVGAGGREISTVVGCMPIRLTQVGALDPTISDYPRTMLEFKHLFPVRRPALAIWSVFGGPKGVQIPVLWPAGR